MSCPSIVEDDYKFCLLEKQELNWILIWKYEFIWLFKSSMGQKSLLKLKCK